MKNCTIIISTWNRTNYLKRLLSYYNERNSDFEFIILDSSSEENKKINKKNISSFPNLRLLYLDYPENIIPIHKLLDSVMYIKTEYCVLCADDDFIVPEGIKESVSFLEANPDFAVAHGKYISFRLNKNNKSQPQFYWQYAYPPGSNVSADPLERIVRNLVNYWPTIYAVYRTEVFKNIWHGAVDSGLDLNLFGELLSSILPLLYGKMKILDIFYCARQEDSSYFTTHGIKRLGVTDHIKKGTYWPKCEKFKKYLVNRLVKISGIDGTEAAQRIDAAMKEYIKASYPPVFHYYRFRVAAALADFFRKTYAPRFIYWSLSFTYRLFFPISASKPNHDFMGTSLAHCQKDLDAIRDKVVSFGKI